MFKTATLLLILGFPLLVFPQTARLDSCKARLSQPASGAETDRLGILLDICREKYSLSGDALCFYSQQAMQLAQKLEDTKAYYDACNAFAWGLSIKGDLDSCEQYTQRHIDLLENKPGYEKQYIGFRITAANNYYKNGKPKASLESMYELLREVEEPEFKTDILNEIGLAYGGMEHFEEEIEWINRSLALNPNPGTVDQKCAYVRSLSNKSIAFIHLYEHTGNKAFADSTYYLADKAESFAHQNGILFFYCQALIMKGYYHSHLGDPEEAERYLRAGIEVRKSINEPIFIVSDMTVLGTFYAKTGQADKGIAICKEALAICEEKKLSLMLVTLAYKTLCQNYEAAGMHKELSGALNVLLSLKDSLYLQNLDGEIEKLDAVYNLQKQEIELARKEISLNKKDFRFYTILITVAFLAVLAGMWFNSYKKNQKLRLHYLLEEEKRKAEQAMKEAKEEERKRIAADLHDNLGVQANAILYTSEVLKQENSAGNELVVNLNDAAKDMLSFLRDSLWALKTADTTAANLWMRVLNFIDRIRRNYRHITFSVAGHAPENVHLTSAKALNILMMIQEATNNAIKHSRAANIDIKSTVTGNEWNITIRDNGIGFPRHPAGEKKDSHGLGNMRQRAQASQIALDIKSMEGVGTEIALRI